MIPPPLPCFVTRTGPEADRLRRLGAIAYPVFAAARGQRFDDVYITFRLDDPIPYCPEDNDISRRRAVEIRAKEVAAVNEMWKTTIRDAGKNPVWLRGAPDELP